MPLSEATSASGPSSATNGKSSGSTLAASQTARHQAEARAAVTASLESVGSSFDADLATRAHDLHGNSKAITKQEAELQKQTDKLRRENDQLEKLLSKGTKSLNEIGDVQNWAESIERDLLVLEETMRLVEEKEAKPHGNDAGAKTTLPST